MPVPGDLIIENPRAGNYGNHPYGHVSVVNYIVGTTIYAVEENAATDGVHIFQYNNSLYLGGYGNATEPGNLDGSVKKDGTVRMILHAPNNFFKNITPTVSGIKVARSSIYITKNVKKTINFMVEGSKNGYGHVKYTKKNPKNFVGIPSKQFVLYNKKITLTIKAKKSGKTSFTITLPNGKIKTIKITVLKKPRYLKKIRKISGDKNTINIGEKAQFKFNLKPTSATNISQRWYVKSTKIKVNSFGQVTGLKKGTANVYLKVNGLIKNHKITVI
jgi:hypothetical protein